MYIPLDHFPLLDRHVPGSPGVQECIDAGVDLNSVNVLRSACVKCSSDVVATLLRGGALVNRRGEGVQAADSGPLYLAAKRGSMPIIAVLIRYVRIFGYICFFTCFYYLIGY